MTQLEVVYQELEAAGLTGQPLEDAFTTIADGYAGLDEVLEVVPAVLGKSNIFTEDDYTNVLKRFGHDEADVTAAMFLIRRGKATLFEILTLPEETSIHTLADISETEFTELTDTECFEVIGEMKSAGFSDDKIIDSLKLIRHKHATLADVINTHVEELSATQAEQSVANAVVEQVFNLQGERIA